MNTWEKFDKMIDTNGLQKDIQEASENGGGNYKEVPLGKYEVKVDKLELSESKKGDPMVKVWFKILSGEYKNGLIFMNQVITKGFQIHIMNEFLKSLGVEREIEFKSYVQYGQLLMDILEDIDSDKLEYSLIYGENKGFNTFEIEEVFEA